MYPNHASNFSGYLGEVRQTADGQLYQLGEVMDELGNYGLAWYPVNGTGQDAGQVGGLGDYGYPAPQLGEIRLGADGQYYQYSVDGLGNVGFAPLAALLPLAAKALPGIVRKVRGFFRPATPGGPQPINVNTNELLARLASLLQNRAPGVSGLGEDADLLGVDDDLDLMGLEDDMDLMGYGEYGDASDLLGAGDDPDLMGLAGDDDLMGCAGCGQSNQGIGEDPDLMGLGADELDLMGIGEEDDINGFADDDPSGIQGYMTNQGGSLPGDTLQGYVKGFPPANPQVLKRTSQPENWRPLWE